MTKSSEELPGVNIQWPWSQLLLSGQKSVETRTYPLPVDKTNVRLAVIETPGPRGRKEAGIDKARIIGTIIFRRSFKYKSKSEWLQDKNRHQVSENDPLYGFDSKKEKWGWEVAEYVLFKKPIPAPKKKGIVFAKSCEIF